MVPCDPLPLLLLLQTLCVYGHRRDMARHFASARAFVVSTPLSHRVHDVALQYVAFSTVVPLITTGDGWVQYAANAPVAANVVCVQSLVRYSPLLLLF